MSGRIVTPAEMRAAEEAAFARGISADSLMEEAGSGIARAIRKFFPRPGKCLVFAGKGHNAGDAFVAARWLAQAGWEIENRLVFPERELTALTTLKLAKLRELDATLNNNTGTIVLDGLLGLGTHPPLGEPILAACREINSLGTAGARVIAIDLPSGLDGESGEADKDCVIADFTLTIASAKVGLIADEALDFVGRLEVIPLHDLQPHGDDKAELATPGALSSLLPRRKYSAYKNQFGRIGIVAGSRGFTGAAVMCSLGALRAGAGLVELFVLSEVYDVVAASAPSEVMVKPVATYSELFGQKIDIWAVGPGLGTARAGEILNFLQDAPQPMVIDADALNILAKKMILLQKPAGPRLLTPHPGEMKRLWPNEQRKSRAEIATDFCQQYPVTLLLKGSRTIVAEAGQPLSYNTTGNPGMATGGMGDVLTGVCGALLGANLKARDAARLGAWLCGRAAEIAISDGEVSEESLLPRDVLQHLGRAFNDLRR